jgi:hypothetical protein
MSCGRAVHAAHHSLLSDKEQFSSVVHQRWFGLRWAGFAGQPDVTACFVHDFLFP